MNDVEHEPVETRVFNPTVSEATYKPKQRSYRKTNLKKKVMSPDSPGAELSGAEISSAESAAPKRTRPVFFPRPQGGGVEEIAKSCGLVENHT